MPGCRWDRAHPVLAPPPQDAAVGRQKAVYCDHTSVRAIGGTRDRHPQDLEDPDQAALLPRHATTMVQAVLVLHAVEADRHPR